jgi:hypothetical protein
MTRLNGRDVSLEELGTLVANSEFAFDMLRHEFANSYDEFVETLYDNIDKAIGKLEQNPQFYEEAEEDKITHEIANMLSMAGYDARQGETNGGNIDLTVKGYKSAWSWIGEAKIYKTIDNLREGFLQLSTRYRTASPVHAKAGILAYIKRKDAAGCLKVWLDEISTMGLDEFSVAQCGRRGALSFYTTHKHEASGLPIQVRHSAISLYHLPKDRSALAAQKYQAAHAAESAAQATAPLPATAPAKGVGA